MPQNNHNRSSIDEQQEKILDDALNVVKLQSFHMKCCLDKGKLMEALKHASNMLSELRTSGLTPKSYYELFMTVIDQLHHLEMYLIDEFQRDHKIYELYELVQYAGSILPRLYLLISVGLVYMKTSPYCRREILKDLVEMCRGVQHPLRGLFLRNFLLMTCRHVLPDQPADNETLTMERTKSMSNDASDSQDQQPTQFVSSTLTNAASNSEGQMVDNATVMDSIDFVLLNFAEMNKLWVRMQHLGHTRDRERREKERLELRLLVGTNLVRLSQLESVTAEIYSRVVLPGILEQVVSCKDAIAQEYLMESLIQVFPDEFHLSTLNPFLNSCAQLAPEVKVKNIIIALIDRLAQSKDVALPDDLFETFSRQISNIICNRSTIIIEDIISMYSSVINFALKKIPDPLKREDAIDSVLGATLKAIQKMNVVTINMRSNLGKEMFRFLKMPFNLGNSTYLPSTTADNDRIQNKNDDFGRIKMSLKLTNYKDLVKETTDLELHKQIILTLINATLENFNEDNLSPKDRLTTNEIQTFLTELCGPLINGTNQVIVSNDLKNFSQHATQSQMNGSSVINDQDEDFIDEQLLLSRFIHFLLLPQCIDSGSKSTQSFSENVDNNGEENAKNGEASEEASVEKESSVQLLDTTYLTLSSIKKILATGGPSRIRFTYPSLVFEALQLSIRYKEIAEIDEKWAKKCKKIYQFVNQLIVTLLQDGNCPELCLRLFLEAALNAARSEVSGYDSISYDFISQALSVYEEEISDSKEQSLCLLLIIGTVKNIKFNSEEDFTPLRNQCCLNCGMLIAYIFKNSLLFNKITLMIES
ncbi:transferase CAF17 [Sarcoptes scabiei]|nr:transferase CAF17 [Sarcoptes scabiei]